MTQLLKIGSKFDNGKVVGIYKNGVLTIRGDVTRFYTRAKVEKTVTVKRKAVPA